MASEKETKKFVSDDGVSTSATPETPEGGSAEKDPKKKNKKDLPDSGKLKEAFDGLLEELEAGDDFKRQLASIFESVTDAKAQEMVESAMEEIRQEIAEAAGEIMSDLQEKVDAEAEAEREEREEIKESIDDKAETIVEGVSKYLDYVAERYLEENAIAIESALVVEKAQRIIEGLTTVMNEARVEVSEEDVDLFEEIEEQLEESKKENGTLIKENFALQAEIDKFRRNAIITEAAKDLTESEAEQLKSLTERLSLEDDESFTADVISIKERMFKTPVKRAKDINEGNEISQPKREVPVVAQDEVASIMAAINSMK